MISYLVDTNIIIRVIVPQDPLSAIAAVAIESLVRQGESLCIGHQNLIEFWCVATRARESNGLGMPISFAVQEINRVEEQFKVLADVEEVYSRWRALVETHHVGGRQVFDARLVALMGVYGISH